MLIFLIATVVVVTLTHPISAQAATKRYRVTASVSNKVMDVHHQAGESYYNTVISGKVSGGPVRGKTVTIKATNIDNPHGPRPKYFTVKLRSSGRYSKTFEPPIGGRWTFRVSRKSAGRYKAAKTTVTSDAFQWAYLHEFYDQGALNLPNDWAQRRLIVGPLFGKTERVNGVGWAEATFTIRGGASLRADTRGSRCKKLYFRAGVADSSEAPSGKLEVRQGSTVLFSKTMSRGQTAYQPAPSIPYDPSRSVEFRVIPNTTYVTDDPYDDIAAVADPAAIKFAIGTPRVFCTFPSQNLD